mgnify:CR=1 FL=1
MGVGDGAGSGGTVPPGGGGGWRGAGQAAVLSGPSATTGLVRTSEPLCSHSYIRYTDRYGGRRTVRGPGRGAVRASRLRRPGVKSSRGLADPPGPCRRPARPSGRRGRRGWCSRGRRGRRGGGSSGRRAGPRGNRRHTEMHPDHRPDGAPPGTARQLRAPAHEHERARRRPLDGGTGGRRRARIGAGPFPDPVNPARCTTTCTTSRPSAGCTMYCAASCGRAHSQ